MEIVVFIQILIGLAVTIWLVHTYSLRSMPIIIKALVAITWFINFSVVIILPLDISYVLLQTGEQKQGMFGMWRAIYWLNFILTWLVLPVCQEYEVVGEFTVKEKLKRAVINNLIIYGIIVGIGVASVVYLIWTDQFNMDKILPILISAASLFGMVLVVVLLSYGLVAIPRSLYKKGDYHKILKRNYYQASKFAFRKEELEPELELRVKQVIRHERVDGPTSQTQAILSIVPDFFIKRWQKEVPAFQKLATLIQLHCDIKRMILDYNRLQTRWNRLLQRTFRIEDIIKDLNSTTKTIQSPLVPKYKQEWLNKLIWFWHCRFKLKFEKVIFVILTIFAAAVVIAELSIFIDLVAPINPFIRIKELKSFITIDIFLLAPFSYIAVCIYYGLFSMRLTGFYGLYSNHQTDAPSLIFLALNLSRVATPLCYNYLQMVDIEEQISFSTVMGQLDMSPLLGHTFDIIFPCLFLLLIIFNSFDVYSKLLSALGLTNLSFEENIKQASVEDGRKRLQKARVQMENKILNRRDKDLEDYKSYDHKVPSSIISSLGTSTQTMSNSTSSELASKQVYYNNFGSTAQGILDL